MAIPELTKRSAEQQLAAYCDTHVPRSMRDRVRLEHVVRGNDLTLVEREVPWRDDMGEEWSKRSVALFRWDPATATWSLRWANRHGTWLAYTELPPVGEFALALREVETDPLGCFWG